MRNKQIKAVRLFVPSSGELHRIEWDQLVFLLWGLYQHLGFSESLGGVRSYSSFVILMRAFEGFHDPEGEDLNLRVRHMDLSGDTDRIMRQYPYLFNVLIRIGQTREHIPGQMLQGDVTDVAKMVLPLRHPDSTWNRCWKQTLDTLLLAATQAGEGRIDVMVEYDE